MALAVLKTDITDLSDAEMRKQNLVQATMISLKKDKRIELQSGDVTLALDALMDETSLLSAFKEEGRAKTKRLPERHRALADTANLVTSAVLSGKISSEAELHTQQQEKTRIMKLHMMDKNLEDFCVVDDASHRMKMHMQVIKSALDDIVNPKPVRKVKGMVAISQSEARHERSEQVLDALNAVLQKNMPITDQWAHDVWEQKCGAPRFA